MELLPAHHTQTIWFCKNALLRKSLETNWSICVRRLRSSSRRCVQTLWFRLRTHGAFPIWPIRPYKGHNKALTRLQVWHYFKHCFHCLCAVPLIGLRSLLGCSVFSFFDYCSLFGPCLSFFSVHCSSIVCVARSMSNIEHAFVAPINVIALALIGDRDACSSTLLNWLCLAIASGLLGCKALPPHIDALLLGSFF